MSDLAEHANGNGVPHRQRMLAERKSLTVKFYIGAQKGHLTIGLDEDGIPKEIFLHDFGKQGSSLQGIGDAWATTISIMLQYGVPLEDIVEQFMHVKFEPAGMTNDPQVPKASSVVDFVMRYLATRFLTEEKTSSLGIQMPRNTVVEVVCTRCSALMSRGAREWVCECGARIRDSERVI